MCVYNNNCTCTFVALFFHRNKMLIYYDIDNTMQSFREIPFFRPRNNLKKLNNSEMVLKMKIDRRGETRLILQQKLKRQVTSPLLSFFINCFTVVKVLFCGLK